MGGISARIMKTGVCVSVCFFHVSQELGYAVAFADIEHGQCFDVTTAAGFLTLGRIFVLMRHDEPWTFSSPHIHGSLVPDLL